MLVLERQQAARQQLHLVVRVLRAFRLLELLAQTSHGQLGLPRLAGVKEAGFKRFQHAARDFEHVLLLETSLAAPAEALLEERFVTRPELCKDGGGLHANTRLRARKRKMQRVPVIGIEAQADKTED